MEMEGDTETFDVSAFICFGGVGAVDMLCVGGTCCGSDLGVHTNGMRGTGEKNSGRGDLGRWIGMSFCSWFSRLPFHSRRA